MNFALALFERLHEHSLHHMADSFIIFLSVPTPSDSDQLRVSITLRLRCYKRHSWLRGMMLNTTLAAFYWLSPHPITSPRPGAEGAVPCDRQDSRYNTVNAFLS